MSMYDECDTACRDHVSLLSHNLVLAALQLARHRIIDIPWGIEIARHRHTTHAPSRYRLPLPLLGLGSCHGAHKGTEVLPHGHHAITAPSESHYGAVAATLTHTHYRPLSSGLALHTLGASLCCA